MNHRVDDEFVTQVNAVGDAREKRSARNLQATKRQSRTDGADEKSRHAESDEWELPNAGGHSQALAFAEIESINDCDETWEPDPGRAIR